MRQQAKQGKQAFAGAAIALPRIMRLRARQLATEQGETGFAAFIGADGDGIAGQVRARQRHHRQRTGQRIGAIDIEAADAGLGRGDACFAVGQQAQAALGQPLAMLLHRLVGQQCCRNREYDALKRQAIKLAGIECERIGEGNEVIERTQCFGFRAAQERLQRRQRSRFRQLKSQSYPVVLGIQDRLDSHQR